jgi:hypothetical protein
MAYTPLFRKIPADAATCEKIKDLQASFEAFWLPINKGIAPNAEKSLGMRRLQEACTWLSRSIAANAVDKKPS